jgi:glycosyltransferase involved in cell wall biosynthesis
MKNILIIEGSLTGHHSVYLKNILYFFLQGNYNVQLVLSDDEITKKTAASFCVDKIKCKIYFLKMPTNCHLFGSALSDLRREFAYREFFKLGFNLVENKKIDKVFLPYIDYCANAIGLFGSPFGDVEFSGIMMRAAFHFDDVGVIAPKINLKFVKKFLFKKLISSKKLGKIFSIDETLHKFASTIKIKNSNKIAVMNDPVSFCEIDKNVDYRVKYNISSNAAILLLYGVIDERKGVSELINALDSEDCPSNIVVLFAGKINKNSIKEEHIKTIEKLTKNKKIIIFDKWITEEEEAEMFCMCNAVWVGYVGHYWMSGVYWKAVLADKHVIATNAGLIGYYAAMNKNATCLNINNNNEIIDAFSRQHYFSSGNFNNNKNELGWGNFMELLKVYFE